MDQLIDQSEDQPAPAPAPALASEPEPEPELETPLESSDEDLTRPDFGDNAIE